MTLDPKALDAARDCYGMPDSVDMRDLSQAITEYLTHAQPAIERAARDRALEEAAVLMEHHNEDEDGDCHPKLLPVRMLGRKLRAAAIRALKEPRT